MKIPKHFERDLSAAYHGDISLDNLIYKQETFLRALAKFALRYRTAWMISEEDDLFQEACIWLVDSMWEWDSSKGPSLSTFVVYNIGARIAGVVRYEKNIKRHPDVNSGWRCDLWGPAFKDDEGDTLESTIDSGVTLELDYILRCAIDVSYNRLSALAQEFTLALIECDGRFNDAVDRMRRIHHVQKRFGEETNRLPYVLRMKIVPEIEHFFEIGDIIPKR